MDADTVNNLITASAALLGALLGGGASIWATSIQQRHERAAEIERERRADERQRRDAAEQRTQLAAVRCDDVIADLAEHIREWSRSGSDLSKHQDYLDVTHSKLRAVEAETHYLPAPLRTRVDEAVQILHRAEHFSEHLYDYDPLSWVAYTVGREMHLVIAGWQRGEGLPGRSMEWCDFVVAAESVHAEHEEMYNEHHGYELQVAQEAWRVEHEESLMRIRTRS